MIIDCHGHYTTAPEPLQLFRDAQLAAFKACKALPEVPHISDEQIQESIEKNQLRLLIERGSDMTIFSPRASAMAHHLGDEAERLRFTQHLVGDAQGDGGEKGKPAHPQCPRKYGQYVDGLLQGVHRCRSCHR